MSLRLSRDSNDVDFLQRQFALRSANLLCSRIYRDPQLLSS